MVELTHTIKDTLGFHARSVMLVSNECARWKSDMVVAHGSREASADDPIALMGLEAHKGDTISYGRTFTISVKISGPDEQDAADFVAHLLRRL